MRGCLREADRRKGMKDIREVESYDREAEVWYLFYTTFNDHNFHHADNSFLNHNYKNSEEVHKANVDWIKEILKRGITAYEIEEDMPESQLYLIEVLGEIATFGVK